MKINWQGIVMKEKKIKFIESKTAYRTINGRDVSDDEWKRRLKGKTLLGLPLVPINEDDIPDISKIKFGGPLI